MAFVLFGLASVVVVWSGVGFMVSAVLNHTSMGAAATQALSQGLSAVNEAAYRLGDLIAATIQGLV